MEVTVDAACVLVVRVLWTEHGWTDRAREMLDVELHICARGGVQETNPTQQHAYVSQRKEYRLGLTKCRDIASSQCMPTFVAQEVESTEVIRFAQRHLSTRTVGGINRKELGRDDLVAVL